jgi:transposase
LDRQGGEDQLSDELIGAVLEAVRPVRPAGHGDSWAAVEPHEAQIKAWLEDGLRLTKVHRLLERRGVMVPYRTLHRFAVERLGFGRAARRTVRVDDPDPGRECQVDFGRMGLIDDPASGRQRVLHALIFTACYSRHSFVWLSFRQTTQAVIAGFEAAWVFFGGVFAVVIPDNLKAIVDEADNLDPRFNAAFLEYAQDRGFVIDPARIRRPTDKPRCERTVAYVRDSWFKGEVFSDIDQAQRSAEAWSRTTAGLRVHGTTCARPAEVFAAEEAPVLLVLPVMPYDLPVYARPKVARDRHIEVAKALYSVPDWLVGGYVDVRADSKLVKVFWRGRLVKVHPRKPPGGRSTDPADMPAHKVTYATRDCDGLAGQADIHGDAVGAYARRLLAGDMPWTKMRQVYRLLGLARRYGDERTDQACQAAIDADVIDVGLIRRILESGPGAANALPVAQVLPLRYARHSANNAGLR